ncbi:MAG: cell division protein SepF [Candidatus Bathyarchaeota archaeon]|nr:cell division protein SepF [Candidatus Bathyarchaeota archaeon]
MPFNLFRKKKQPEQEKPAVPPQEEPKQEAPAQPPEETHQEPAITTQEPPQENTAPVQETPPETVAPPVEQKPEATEPTSKTYLKAMPLRELSDLENIKTEVKNGNIIILRVTPLAGKSIEDVKTAVNELFQFAESIGGDIARLGEERVVICPKTIRIWREKSPAPVSSSSEPLPTAA